MKRPPPNDIVIDIMRGGEAAMASIVVRGLEEWVKEELAVQAKRHGRSMEAEVRDILTKAARTPHIGLALLQAAQRAGGIDDLVVPERDDVARAVEFE
jgi:plasmid stability protein